jgi:hypothetical protein
LFCPRCKAEYRAGFRKCSDCDIALVDQLRPDPPAVDPPTRSAVDHPDLVVVRTYQNVIDANLAKTALDAVRIDSMVVSDNGGGQSHLAFSRGVELLVRADDLDTAVDVLSVEGVDGNDSE